MNASVFHIQKTATQVARWLANLAFTLAMLHLISLALRLAGFGNALGIPRLFDMDMEMSIPALYSTTLFLFNSGLFFLLGVRYKAIGQPTASARLMGWVFIFLAIDENCQIHENLNIPLESYFPVLGHENIAWIIPYAVALLVLAALLGPFFFRLPSRFKKLFALSGITFLLGAVVVEYIGAQHRAAMTQLLGSDYLYQLDWADGVLVAVEETLELSGLVLLAYSLLSYFEALARGIQLRVGPAEDGESQ